MGEEISQLVDGELEAAQLERVCARLGDGKALEAWVAYHLIGDAMRQSASVAPGFHQRFSERLAAEPTVLAPPRRAPRPHFVPWAVAASVAAVAVVGWIGLREIPAPPLGAAAQVQTAEIVSAAATRPLQSAGYNDYLMVHQAYSPATALQGVRPYIRTVAESGQEAR